MSYDSSDGTHGTSRCYLVKGSMFLALVSCEGNDPPATETTKFLDSMSTADAVGRGPLKQAGPDYANFGLAGSGISVRLPRKPEQSEADFGPKSRPIKMTRFVSSYGNRTYGCGYADLDEDVIRDFEGKEDEYLDAINSDVFKSTKATDRKDSHYNLEGARVLTTRGKIGRNEAFRVDTFIKGKRLYSLITDVPPPMLESDEVKQFFASIKFEK